MVNPLLQCKLAASGLPGHFNVLASPARPDPVAVHHHRHTRSQYIDSWRRYGHPGRPASIWRRFSEIGKPTCGPDPDFAPVVAVTRSCCPARVSNFGLALAAGALEFLPVIGPVASSVLIILVALFQDSTAFGLTTVQYGLLVTLCVVAVQQIESNLIVPRIIGNSLRLHPVVVLLSVLMGTSLAGVLGAVLAAPVMASAKLVVTYAWYRVLDQPLTFLEESSRKTRNPSGGWDRPPAAKSGRCQGTRTLQARDATVAEARVPGGEKT